MLKKQKVNVSMVGGIDTKTDDKSMLAADYLELENMAFDDTKALKKRNGSSVLGTTVTSNAFNTAYALASNKNELVQFTNGGTHGYSNALSKWAYKGYFKSSKTESLISTGFGAQNNFVHAFDSSTSFSVVAAPFTEAGVNYVTAKVFDTATGGLIFSQTLPPSFTYSRVESIQHIGTVFFIFVRSTIGTITTYIADLSSALAFTALGTTISTASGQYAFCTSGSKVFISYIASSTTSARLISVNTSGTFSAALEFFNDAAIFPLQMALCSSSVDDVRVFYGNITVGYKSVVANNALNGLSSTIASLFPNFNTGANTKELVVVKDINNAANAVLFFRDENYNSSVRGHELLVGTITSSNTVFTNLGTYFYDCSIVSANCVIATTSNAYVLAVQSHNYMTEGTGQGTRYLLDVFNRSIIAAYEYDIAEIPISYEEIAWFPTNLVYQNSKVYAASLISPQRNTATPPAVSTPSKLINVRSFELDKVYYTQPTKFKNNLAINNSYPKIYDGAVLTELGFIYPPSCITSIVSTGVSGLVTTGTYQVAVTYSWVDSNGETYESQPYQTSVAVASTLTRLRVIAKTLRWTNKADVDINIYLSAANGTVLYLQKSIPNSLTSLSTQHEFVTDVITNTEILYSQLELENNFPKTADYIQSHKNRLFYIDETGQNLRHSKIKVNGFGPEFNNNLSISLDSKGGKAVALASLDEYLVIFKSTAIFVLSGDGPNNQNTAGGYRDPALITSEVGCSEPQSVVTTPLGIMFKSLKGIYLLGRDLQLKYIGDKVEDFNATTITSAVLVDKKHEVRFALTTGTALVYDYYVNKWSTFKNYPFIDMCMHNNTFHAVTSAGVVNYEVEAAASDNGTVIDTKIVTAWVSLADIQGFARLYQIMLLGEYVGAHVLKVSIAYDYNDSYVDEYSHTVSSDPTNYQYAFYPKIQKCMAFKLKIETLISGAASRGAIISNLALIVGVKEGNNKLSSSSDFALT